MQLDFTLVPDLIEYFSSLFSSDSFDHRVVLFNVPEVFLIDLVNLSLMSDILLLDVFLHCFFERSSKFFRQMLSYLLTVLLVLNVIIKFRLNFLLKTLLILCH
jgi:hypothetical protein